MRAILWAELRMAEMTELRTGDVATAGQGVLLTLRNTKMGQRVGLHQEVCVRDPWLRRRICDAVRSTRRGDPLLGMTPYKFRRTWASVRAELGVNREAPAVRHREVAPSVFP